MNKYIHMHIYICEREIDIYIYRCTYRVSYEFCFCIGCRTSGLGHILEILVLGIRRGPKAAIQVTVEGKRICYYKVHRVLRKSLTDVRSPKGG